MPPRYAYWTIILEGKPTAFRAHAAEELEPTLRQLRNRHPDAVMMWFARGRLWESPDKEREERFRRDSDRERRGPDWRPGGGHRDPRDRFKVPRDVKRRRFAERQRHEGGQWPGTRSHEGPPPRDRARPENKREAGAPTRGQSWAAARTRAPGSGPGTPRSGRPGSQKGPGEDRRRDQQRSYRPAGSRDRGRKPGGGGRRGGGGPSR